MATINLNRKERETVARCMRVERALYERLEEHATKKDLYAEEKAELQKIIDKMHV